MKIIHCILLLGALIVSTAAYAFDTSSFVGKSFSVDFGSDLTGVVTFTSDTTILFGDKVGSGSPTAVEITKLSDGMYSVSWTLQMRSVWKVRQTFNFEEGKVHSYMRSGEKYASMGGQLVQLN